MNAVQIVEVETALRNLAEDCRMMFPSGLPSSAGMQAEGYGGAFRSGLERLAGLLDTLVGQLKALRSRVQPDNRRAALELLRNCRTVISDELDQHLRQSDQWSAGQSTAFRWCLPALDDIIRSVERAK